MVVAVGSCTKNDGNAALAKLFDEYWRWQMEEDPVNASSFGLHEFDARLAEVGLAAEERRGRAARQFLERLRALLAGDLPPAERLNARLLEGELAAHCDESSFETYLAPLSQRWGPQIELPQLADRMSLRTAADYRNYIARMRQVPQAVDGTIELLREGLRRGHMPPRVTLAGVLEQIDAQTPTAPEACTFYRAFAELPAGISAEEAREIRDGARTAIESGVIPAFRRLREFLERDYLPAARDSIACSALPRGEELYRHRVRRNTTTELSPQEIHELGLREVARIRGEMESVIRATGFDGDFHGFVEFLRSDPRFYYDTAEDLMRGYRDICKRMDAELPRLFGKLPRIPYGVREIPDFEAPRATTAYYRQPHGDGSQPGWFYANTYDLDSRPRYEMEALAFHEAVPGHHLQIALQMEREDVPQFRRQTSYTAFVEGWGLYAEALGKEVGFYADPYSEFGRLSYEMWRALRLVVDTGIHAFQWSRERAIDHMLANSALPRTNVEAEVDRYISWPGQALAYKIGQLTISELRASAERELGAAFDLRAFHDHLLAEGPIPLQLLRERMQEVVAAKRAGARGQR